MTPITSALGSALPQAVDAYMKRALVNGAAPIPLVKLNTDVAGLGPYTLDNGGAFTMTVYAGPTLQFSVTPKLGTLLDASA
ncbi:MAG TPA: hypothetical protein VFL64_01555 [Rhizobacter sp.]|nr:hypothetical protein [Rhizobacter sp.]